MFRIAVISTALSVACVSSAMAAEITIQASTERLNSPQVGQIRADAAHSQDYTGKGVTIAVLDTGLNIRHIEFHAADKLLQGYNAIDGSGDVSDYHGHGTHVSGIAAALRNNSGMMGIAFDARILPIKVLPDNGFGSTTWIDSGMRYAIGKAWIVSLSLTSPGAYSTAATRGAVDRGLLIVAAAGNSGQANPEWPARFAKEYWSNGQIIAVGAVDANNQIASFSNRAGDTANWFLVAPGVNIHSSYLSGYANLSGTSMAAPVVAGAAAVVKQHWPALTAKSVAQILFKSATDLGAAGIDPIYGHGLVNLERAMQPIGSLTTTSSTGQSLTLVGSSLQTSAASIGLWQLASAGDLRLVGLDDFRRDFTVDLGAHVSRPQSLSLQQVWGRLDSRIELAERVLADGSRLMAVYERQQAPLPGVTEAVPARDVRLAGFSYTSGEAGGRRFMFGNGGYASHAFGVGGLAFADGPSLAGVHALANPYFALVPRASHAAISQRLGIRTRLSMGMLTSALDPIMSTQWGASATEMPKAHAALLELSHAFDAGSMALTLTQTTETGAWLGTQSRGALSLGKQATTSALQLASAWRIAPKLTVAAQYALGFTPAGMHAGKQIVQLGNARTQAAAIALVAADSWTSGDRLSLSVAQPMRTYSGTVAIDAIVGLDQEGNPVRRTRSHSLVPNGWEILTEASYMAPVGAQASVGLSLTLRQNPDHAASASSEKLVALRYTGRF